MNFNHNGVLNFKLKHFIRKLVFLFTISTLCVLFYCSSISYARSKDCEKRNVYNLQEKYNYVNINWWDKFNDPCLKEYILKTLECNHDLKKASWQVEEFRQNARLSFNQELPTMSVSTVYTGINTPRFFGGRDIAKNVFAVPFILRYEPDLLLKNRDKTKSATKAYEASRFEEQATYISLVSDVTTTYLNIIKFDKMIDLQTQLVDLKSEVLKRETNKYNRGTITATELNDVKKDLESACNNLNDLIKMRQKALNQLAVFIGDPPEDSNCLKRKSFDKFEYCAEIPCSVPSDVIFGRPDVQAAQKKIEKAKIDVRISKKEFFPRFNIVGIYAFNNAGSDNFFSWKEAFALAFAGATQDIFKGGAKVTGLRISRARCEQLFENYQQTDLNALQEVQNSLSYIVQDTKIDNETKDKLQIQIDSYNRVINKYNRGVASCLDVLTAKQAVIAMDQSTVDSKTARIIDYITLYKAVGGQL